MGFGRFLSYKNLWQVALACCVLFLSNPSGLMGQDSSKLVIGAEGHHGFVIIHSRDVRSVKNSYPSTGNLNINWQNIAKSTWNRCHCYPRTGFSLAYQDFDNQAVLGQGVTFSGYLEPFFRLGESWAFAFKSAVGLSYLNNPYDPKSNPENQSYSVRLNGFLRVNTSINYRLSPHWQVALAANYNHISNGGIKKPNKGINYPTAGISLDYQPKTWRLPDFKESRGEVLPGNRHNGEVSVFLGTQERQTKDQKQRHWNYGVEAFYNYQLTPLHQLRIGANWIHNNAVRGIVKADPNTSMTFHKYQRINLLAGHAFSLGQFRFSALGGFYIYRPYENESDWFQRYSLTYALKPPFHVGVGLKAHAHRADFLDVRVSYRF